MQQKRESSRWKKSKKMEKKEDEEKMGEDDDKWVLVFLVYKAFNLSVYNSLLLKKKR